MRVTKVLKKPRWEAENKEFFVRYYMTNVMNNFTRLFHEILFIMPCIDFGSLLHERIARAKEMQLPIDRIRAEAGNILAPPHLLGHARNLTGAGLFHAAASLDLTIRQFLFFSSCFPTTSSMLCLHIFFIPWIAFIRPCWKLFFLQKYLKLQKCLHCK